MKKVSAALFVLAFAAVAWANVSFVSGIVHINMDGPPPYVLTCACNGGPPATIIISGVVYTFDEETETYKAAPPNGDTWAFDANGNATFTDWPPFPQSGPPTVKTGYYY